VRTLATTLVIAALTLVTLPAQNNGPARLAGAFRLTAGGKATGYLFFDPSGLYAMAIQQAGRGRFAAAQPTPAEALAAVTTYSGSFGHYDVDGSMLTLHKDGSFDPNETRTEERDPFTFDGTRLIMTTTHARAGVGPTIEWERMPDLPNLTPLQRRFLGFRKLVLNEIRNEKGEVLPGPSGGVDAGGTKFFPEQTGYIVYTAAGAMMVHMMHPNRPKYHGAQPSGEEAQNIIHTYNIYFGSWVVNEADGIVVHKREGSFKPNTIDDVPRRFVFEGKRLTLMPPPSTQGDDTRQGYLGWELP
jgi:hypothetical protein